MHRIEGDTDFIAHTSRDTHASVEGDVGLKQVFRFFRFPPQILTVTSFIGVKSPVELEFDVQICIFLLYYSENQGKRFLDILSDCVDDRMGVDVIFFN